MWTTAAPACAASSAEVAICCGVMGSPGCCSGFVRLPVTAQVIMVFRACMINLAVILGKAPPAVDNRHARHKRQVCRTCLDRSGDVVGGTDASKGGGRRDLFVKVRPASGH